MKTYDTIIRNGILYDGVRTPHYQADIGIQGDTIAAIGDLAAARASEVIDAAGKCVCPGFIDVHAHSDTWLLTYPNFVPKTSQGYTTEFLMLDGISYAPTCDRHLPEWTVYLRGLNGMRLPQYAGWKKIAEFMRQFDRQNAQNTASFIPYGNLRAMICGFDRSPADDFQLKSLRAEVAQAMAAGALGLSTGFDYLGQLFSSTTELVAVCKELANTGGVYVSHIRYQIGILDGLREAVEIGKKAGVPVHISHLKGSTPAEAEAILAFIDDVAAQEVDFSFDVYPYSASSTLLSTLLPHEVWTSGSLAAVQRLKEPAVKDQFARRLETMPLEQIVIAWTADKSHQSLQGKTLMEYIGLTGKAPAEALTDLLIEDHMAVLLVFMQGDDALVSPFLSHPNGMIGSDGIFQEDGAIHPRIFGTAARILGRCRRDLNLFSLEEAVYKLSGYPARRFKIDKRGAIREGYFADLVCLDADAILDQATFENPRQLALGISQVWVNGEKIWQTGQPCLTQTAVLPGRFLCRGEGK